MPRVMSSPASSSIQVTAAPPWLAWLAARTPIWAPCVSRPRAPDPRATSFELTTEPMPHDEAAPADLRRSATR